MKGGYAGLSKFLEFYCKKRPATEITEDTEKEKRQKTKTKKSLVVIVEDP